MDERSKLDLPYGHFGRAEYSTDDGAWSFARAPEHESRLRSLGISKTISLNSLDDGSAVHRYNQDITSKRHTNGIKQLTKENPDLVPARDILSPLFLVSEASQHAVREHDPTLGTVLAFAQLRSIEQHKTIDVAAFASGSTGSILRFCQLQMSSHSWEDLQSPQLLVPWLTSDGSVTIDMVCPIQQVRFSLRGDRGNPLLAVRTTRGVSIFQPWHRNHGSARNLGLDLLHSLDPFAGSVCPYSDFNFNPWFPQQIGLVNGEGMWKIVEFESRTLKKVSKTMGTSLWTDPKERKKALDDGWARITWIHNIQNIAVCTRQKLTLYNVADGQPTIMKIINFDFSLTSAWALDLLILPGLEDKLHVVTSTHLLVYDVGDLKDGLAIRSQEKIRHFKSPDDLSLRLLGWIEEETTNIILRSRTSNSFNHYRLSVQGSAVTSDCPMVFEVAETGSLQIADMHIRPARTAKTFSRSKSTIDTDGHPANNPCFHIITVLHDDRSLTESLFYHFHRDGLLSEHDLDAPSREKMISIPKKISTAKVRTDESFVVDDNEVEPDEHISSRFEPLARRRRRPQRFDSSKRRSVNLELVARRLNSAVAEQSIEGLCAEIRDVITKNDPDPTSFMPTLNSFLRGELVISDIETAMANLEQSLQRQDLAEDDFGEPARDEPRLAIATIHIPSSLGLDTVIRDGDLGSIYNHIVDGWISPLSPQIPGWVRLAKAAIARRVAVELMLAGRSLQYEGQEALPTQQSQDTEVESQTWLLPNQIGNPSSSPVSMQQPLEVAALPTPSSSRTPSIITTSTSRSSMQAQSFQRLGRYAKFDKGPPPELPRSLRSVLTHWDVSETMEDYDWMAVSKKVTKHNEEDEEEMTEKERRHRQRRVERHLRRQRKEAAASQAQQMASSRATEVFSASQPPAVHIESSQPTLAIRSSQAPSQGQGQGLAPASQILPGKFGGRAPKRKKRKIGF